jgi:hypothetical protein
LGKLFNILGTSIALLAHFAGNPVAHAMKRHHHRLVLRNLAKEPTQVRISNLQHFKGHCYSFDIEEHLITDGFASSTILLFEDGKPLRFRHSRDVEKIASAGGGRMFHNRDKIFFSTPDNSSPMGNGRGYVAVHSPTEDADTFNRLQTMSKTSAKTGAAKLADMLAILCPRHFGFERAEGEGAGVVLHQVRIAIDSKAEIVLTADQLIIVHGPGETWSFELQNLRTDNAELPPLTIRGIVDIALRARRWIRQVEIIGANGFALGMTTFDDGKLTLTAGRPDFLRAPLLANFRNEAEMQEWITRVFDRLCGPLEEGGFALHFDAAARAIFFEMLASDTLPARYVFSTTTAPENRLVKLERLPFAS